MFQQGKDAPFYYLLSEAPLYHAWAEERRENGETEELLTKLEELRFWMRPSELVKLCEKDFERMLADLKHEHRCD